MNKFKLAFLSMLFGCAVFAQAQADSVSTTTETEIFNDRYKVTTNHFFDNWFIGAGAGAQIYFGEHDAKQTLTKRMTPTFNFNVGKWFTPGIGLQLGVEGSNAYGLTDHEPSTHIGGGDWYLNFYSTDYATGGKPYDKDGTRYYEQKIKYAHLSGQALFNLTNLFCGYKDGRFYNLIPHAGFGYIFSTNKSAHEKEFTMNAGILNTFRLSDALNLTLDFRGTGFSKAFGHKRLPSTDTKGGLEVIGSASVGVVYKFNKRNWDRSVTNVTNVYNENELNDLRQKLREANDRANNRQPEVVIVDNKPDTFVLDEQTLAFLNDLFNSITFDFNKATIIPNSYLTLDRIAEYFKANGNARKYLITGYTDAVGSPTYNLDLSKKRAKAVVDALKERGVSPELMKYRGVGSKVTIAKAGATDETRRGDRKISVELIYIDSYWDIIPW